MLGIHLNAAQGIDDGLKSGEVYPEVVVDVDAIVLGQGVLALVHTVESRVGELVGIVIGAAAGQGDIEVAGGVEQQHLAGLGIDGGDDVHVAAAGGHDVAVPGVAAADVHGEHRVRLGDGGLVVVVLRLHHHVKGLDFPQPVHGILIALQVLQYTHVALVGEDGIHLALSQGVHQLGGAGVGLGGKGGLVFLVQLLDGGLGVGLRHGQGAEGLVQQVLHVPVIVGADIDGHQRGLIFFGSDVVQGVHADVDVANAHGEDQAEDHGQHRADGQPHRLGTGQTQPPHHDHGNGYHCAQQPDAQSVQHLGGDGGVDKISA